MFMLSHWFKQDHVTGEQQWVEEETIDTTFYINNNKEDDIYITNLGLLTRKMVAWQKEPINYELDLKSISIEKGGIYNFLTQETLYIKRADEASGGIHIPNTPCNEQETIGYLERNNIRYVVEYKSMSGRYIQHEMVMESKFLGSLSYERYKLYENDLETIWVV